MRFTEQCGNAIMGHHSIGWHVVCGHWITATFTDRARNKADLEMNRYQYVPFCRNCTLPRSGATISQFLSQGDLSLAAPETYPNVVANIFSQECYCANRPIALYTAIS
jgi:hypothetical protein